MIYIIKNKIKWNFYLNKYEFNNIFYTYNFASLFFDNARLFVYENNNKIALFCFTIIKNKIKSLKYNGIIFNNKNSTFKLKVKKSFYNFIKDKKIKGYQIEDSPFWDTIKIGKIIKKEPFVFIHLTKLEEQLKKEISKNHRKSINKAKKENLKIFETKNIKYLPIFYILYRKQLKLKKVKYKTFSFFKKMFSNLDKNLSFVCIKDNEKIIAISIILNNNNNIFMIYGGMDKKGYSKCAKHLMIYNLIFKYKKKGYSKLILGTGNKRNDSIYNFKKGFTNEVNHIYTYGDAI